MKLDKPVVFLRDIPEIMSSYNLGRVLEAKYLGGVPNVTYRVVTPSTKVAVRICNHGYTSPEHLATEIDLLLHLQAVGFKESPVPIRGTNQKIIQNWRGYPVFAMHLIEGLMGDQVEISCELCHDVGRVIAQMKQHLSSYTGSVPDGESFWERGLRLLKMLPQTSRTMNWRIDTEVVFQQWQQASDKVTRCISELNVGVVHTDVWPPNMICQGNKVVGVVDFDDWAVGPTFIDLIACLTEFPWYNRLDFNPDFAYSLLEGYFSCGGRLSRLERTLLPEAMEMTCASWLACNALHNMQLAESMIYLQKLELLRDQQRRKSLSKVIESCIDAALSNRRQTS